MGRRVAFAVAIPYAKGYPIKRQRKVLVLASSMESHNILKNIGSKRCKNALKEKGREKRESEDGVRKATITTPSCGRRVKTLSQTTTILIMVYRTMFS